MNPENAAIKSLDARTRNSEIAETATRLLRLHESVSLRLQKCAIKIEDFEGFYDAAQIKKDQAYVARRKDSFAQSDKETGPNGLSNGDVRKLAEILEYQILHGINVGKWILFVLLLRPRN